MQALVLTDKGPRLLDRPFEPRAGEATVRVSLAGVCATDLELARGYMGFHGVMGHEWVGVVEDAPDRAWVGRRVVGDINCPCGRCATCRAGRPTHCPQRTVLGIVGRDGAFAERLSLPLCNLHPVPDEVSDEHAVFVEPLAAALQILEQVHVRPSDRVIVLGTGRLGQLCARVLALTGARVAGLGRNPQRQALLPPEVERVQLPSEGSPLRADLVVDCTGSAEGLSLATALVRPRGVVVLKTTVHDLGGFDPNAWVIDEVSVVGSRCGPFEPALRLLRSGAVDPRPLISATYPLAQAERALTEAAWPDRVKVLLRP